MDNYEQFIENTKDLETTLGMSSGLGTTPGFVVGFA